MLIVAFFIVFLIGVSVGIGISALLGANGPDEEAPDTDGMGLLTFRDVGDGK